MTPEKARELITDALAQIVPDADLDALSPTADLRDTLELDSLDFLNFIETLSDSTGRRIEEDDYPHFVTLAEATAFLTTGA